MALPLILDEALTSSDPARFRAVVEGLLALAREGRQIFYLTCDPVDVDHWLELCAEAGAPAPRVVDLAQVRGLAASARGPAALRPPEHLPAPEPGSDPPAEYGARLGVCPPRRFEPVDSWHLFHLLRDDLGLLHRVLRDGRLATVGQWRLARRNGATRGWLGEAEAARVDARVELARCFGEAFDVGRGRPLLRSALAEAALKGRFLDEIDALAAKLGRDARATFAALEAGRVERFGGSRRARLRSALEEAGILDGREVLGETAVRQRALAGVADRLESGLLDPEQAHRRIDEWWSYLVGERREGDDGVGSRGAGETRSHS